MSSESLQKLTAAEGAGDADAAALAVKSLLKEEYNASDLAQASDRVASMAESFRRSKNNAKLAPALLMSAELHNAQDLPGPALMEAEEAAKLFRSLGQGKGLANALELAFQAHLFQMNHLAGLKAINTEAQSLKQAGDKTGEIAVLETLAHAHAMLGEPYSAISAYEKVLQIQQALGDKEGQGSTQHSIAEMMRVTGEDSMQANALDMARQSNAAFKAAKCQWGEEKARATISSLMARQGKMQKAPNRQEALKALKQFTQAVKDRNVTEAKDVETKLQGMRELITDEEIIEHLQPLVAADPDTTKFLVELGWSMGEGGGSQVASGDKLSGTYVKQFSHQAFYLNTMMGGMGFGPQFRSVNPYRKGRCMEEFIALSVTQLPETEGWQMELGFRPGAMDSALQQMGSLGFP